MLKENMFLPVGRSVTVCGLDVDQEKLDQYLKADRDRIEKVQANSGIQPAGSAEKGNPKDRYEDNHPRRPNDHKNLDRHQE